MHRVQYKMHFYLANPSGNDTCQEMHYIFAGSARSSAERLRIATGPVLEVEPLPRQALLEAENQANVGGNQNIHGKTRETPEI